MKNTESSEVDFDRIKREFDSHLLRKAIDNLDLTIFKNPKEKEFAELLKVVF